MKREVIDGISYSYDSSWIDKLESERHWRAYWRQQRLMDGLIQKGQHVLEIGVGTGFAANYLRSKGITVTTLDIDAEKNPDILTNIVTYDWPEQYDHILGFEVFEHIPFTEFQRVLKRLAVSSRGYLFLSVPANRRVWLRCEVHMPRIGMRQFSIVLPKRRITTATHFWEIDHGSTTMKSLEGVFAQAGFDIQRSDKFFTWHFFALKSPESLNKT